MKHYVLQFGDHFFELKTIRGSVWPSIFPETEITKDEYKKLFYSGSHEVIKDVRRMNGEVRIVRVQGNASEILGYDVAMIQARD